MLLPCLTLVLANVSITTIGPDVIQPEWEGWGTSLCWMGKMFGDRDDIADALFSTKEAQVGDLRLPGLGMNIVRYNAGACSWNEIDGRRMVIGRTIQPFRQMEGFWLNPAKPDPDSDGWDWSVDAKQRTMMQKAKERGADRFELFSNAPMWWMCKNDNPSGGADPNKDNLRDDHFEAFAHYMAAVAAKSKLDWGVPFTTIDPFNEPLSSWWDENCKQEGCHFSVAAQRRLLPLLRRDLDRRGLRDLPIAASDETFVSQAIDAWKGYDDATRALVAQINVHGYQGDKSPRAQFRELIGERKLWMSEHGEGDGSGLELAKNLHLDFRHLKPTAWCYWQPLDGGGWGMLESDVPKAKMNSANPKYFVVAQYTRHIRPGMAILATSDVDSVAAWDPARKRLVVIVTNLEKTESSKTLDLSAFATLGPTARRWCTEPKAFARYRKLTDVPVQDKKLSVTLPPESVTTFEVSP